MNSKFIISCHAFKGFIITVGTYVTIVTLNFTLGVYCLLISYKIYSLLQYREGYIMIIYELANHVMKSITTLSLIKEF